MLVDGDAFSSGQISSKIWLCEELEKMAFATPQRIWVLGGWHGMASFLLLSRNRMPVDHIRSFDIDESTQPVADTILENWVWQGWKFKAFVHDCNELEYVGGNEWGNTPALVINTSVEHFSSNAWFDRIPSGTVVALQCNNMIHDDHHSCVGSLEQMVETYPLSGIKYQGQLDFNYPGWGFSRFMIIGTK